MKIAFYHDHHDDLGVFAQAVDAAARTHPGVGILHLTTSDGPSTPAPAKRVTDERLGTFGARRAAAYAMAMQSFGPDVLFLDSDCHLRGSVSDVWKEEFDVAATRMERPIHHLVPANMGVVFSRSRRFWFDLYSLNREVDWQGGSRTWANLEANYNNLLDSGRYRVLWLPGRIYNAVPQSAEEPMDNALIVHWKGGRKVWVRV